MVIWLEAQAAGLGADDGILRADEVQAVLAADAVRRSSRERRTALLEQAAKEARAITDAAHAEAEHMLEAARMQAEDLLVQAQAEAQQQFDAGYAAGEQRAAVEWHALLQQRREARAGALAGLEAALAGIAVTAVERLVQAQPRAALWRQALLQVQSLTGGGARAVMRVAPSDLPEATAAVDDMARGPGGEPAPIEVRADAGLQPGDCVFESEHGVLNASLSLQLHGLRAALGRAITRLAPGAASLPADAPAAEEPVRSVPKADDDPDDAYRDDDAGEEGEYEEGEYVEGEYEDGEEGEGEDSEPYDEQEEEAGDD